MVSWYITGSTIFCDAVGDNVFLLVYEDSKVKCTGYQKYFGNIKKRVAKELKSRGKKLSRELKCEGLGCARMIRYKNKVFDE
jgi:hypothetical protein